MNSGERMKKAEWENYFAPQILKRGFDYYRSGCVLSLDEDDTENCIEAVVSGTEDYFVNIYLDKSQKNIVEMDCDCPYAEDGSHCKHMAAVLYAVDDNLKNVPDKTSNCTKQVKSIEEIIESLTENKAKELLLFAAENDKKLAKKIMLNDTEGNSEDCISDAKREIRLLICNSADRYGYIDYYDAYDLTNDLTDFVSDVADTLLDQGDYTNALELVCYAYEELNSFEMDDSEGGLSMFESTCNDIWKEIAENADTDLKRKAYNWFFNHHMHNQMFELFNDCEFLEKDLEIIDYELENTPESRSYYLPYYIQTKCGIMRQLEYPQSAIDSFRNKYRHLHEIRWQEAKEYIDNRQYDKAEKLILQSKTIDKNTGYLENWSDLLLGIYRETNQTNKYKQELEYMIFNINQFNFTYITELKSLTDKQEWNDILNKLIHSKSVDYIKSDLLCREGLYYELLNLLIAKGSSNYFSKYDDFLRKRLPIETRDEFLKVLNIEIQSANSRNKYADLAHKLCRIKKYPDGAALANKTALDWAEKYKRRSAMLQELRYVGFDV